MKKFLLTATMLVGLSVVSKAQQGRVGINTTTPSATLDVVANTTDNTRPDALLVPRLSRAQLEAKNTAYLDGTAGTPSAQDGALVFVNGLGGTGAGKTVNVTATGFYYYDGTVGNNVWKAVGGGAPVTAFVVSAEQTSSYVVPVTEDAILFNVSVSGQSVTLPTAGIPIGKRLYITNRGQNGIDIIPAPRELANTQIQPSQGAILMYLGGSGAGSWSYLTGF